MNGRTAVAAAVVVVLGVLAGAGAARAQYNVIKAPTTADQVRVQYDITAPEHRSEVTREYLEQDERRRKGDTVESKDISKTVDYDEHRRSGSDIVRPGGKGGKTDPVSWAKQNWQALFALLFVVGGGIWFLNRR